MWEGHYVSIALPMGKGKKHHDLYRGSQLTCFWVLVPSSTQQLPGQGWAFSLKIPIKNCWPTGKQPAVQWFRKWISEAYWIFAELQVCPAESILCIDGVVLAAMWVNGTRWSYMNRWADMENTRLHVLGHIIKIKGCNYTHTLVLRSWILIADLEDIF